MFEKALEIMVICIGLSIAIAILCTGRLMWTVSDNMHKESCEYQSEYYEPYEEQ